MPVVVPSAYQEIGELGPPNDESLISQLEAKLEEYYQQIPQGSHPADHQLINLKIDVLEAVLKAKQPCQTSDLMVEARMRFGRCLDEELFSQAIWEIQAYLDKLPDALYPDAGMAARSVA